jgi:hypothetical protein
MIATTVGPGALISRSRTGRFCICLTVGPTAREDAWEMCRVAAHYGGMEVRDCCFAFQTEERWLAALEALRVRFGPEYFEGVELGEEI